MSEGARLSWRCWAAGTSPVLAPRDVGLRTAKGRGEAQAQAGSDLSGKIKHRGGLSLSKGGTTVGVENFVIDTSAGVLTAKVVGSRDRIPLLKLDLTNLQAFVFDDSAVLRGVGATLTDEAATALNAVFETDLFAEGLTIGTADVFAIVAD